MTNTTEKMAIKFEQFHEICRFCLKTNMVLYSLFEENASKSSILKKSLGFEISAGDGLPPSICEECTDKLMVCHDFYSQCRSATQVLNTILAEHYFNNDAEMKQEVCTEVVYLEQEVDQTIHEQHSTALPDSCAETIKIENNVTVVQEDGKVERDSEQEMPKKRIRKQPEYQNCFICGLRCRYLNRHIGIMHSNGTKYEYDICKTYCARSKGQLYIHMGAKHINKAQSEFVCSVCDRNFKSLKKLNNHMAAKHPARRHPCPHCRLVFKSERTLNRHQSIHTGERNFICEECGKAFRQTETLRNHQLRHFPPTVPCPHCDKMFYAKSQLRNHEGIHTGLRPWQCDICSASFVASSGLTVHRNKHKRENRFPACKLCGEQFDDRLDFRMHMNDHRKSLI